MHCHFHHLSSKASYLLKFVPSLHARACRLAHWTFAGGLGAERERRREARQEAGDEAGA